MATFTETFTNDVEFELRPCLVGEDKKKGLFHQWENYSEVVGESCLIGGHSAGAVGMTFGLVEFEDGTVKRCNPYDIQFVDNKFEEYFSEKMKTE